MKSGVQGLTSHFLLSLKDSAPKHNILFKTSDFSTEVFVCEHVEYVGSLKVLSEICALVLYKILPIVYFKFSKATIWRFFKKISTQCVNSQLYIAFPLEKGFPQYLISFALFTFVFKTETLPQL